MKLSRRALIAASAAAAAACREREDEPRAVPPHPGSPSSQLVRALGPWPVDDPEGRAIAESFQKGQAPQVPAGVELGRLAARCLAERRATGAVALAALSEVERRYLLDFAAALYRIPDVLAALTGAPPEGACPADRLAYTRAPG